MAKTTTTRSKARAETETTITFPLSKELKTRLQERVDAVPEMTLAGLCRLALDYQEKRGWKDIPYAQPPKA